jgi:hypothetical protein
MKQICLLMLMPTVWAFQPRSGASSNLQRLTMQSNFVFQGTVVRLNATTEPQVRASPSTAVVLVEKVIQGDNMVSDVKGREITVQLLKPRSVATGRPVVFFSNLAVAGKSIAVKEVAHFDAARNGSMAVQVANQVNRKPDIELQARIAGAELIVTGTVASVRRLERAGPLPSEHDPEWMEASVTVQSTEKGAAQTSVIVWFPSSDDIRWFRSPKFQTGQSGIFLLRHTRQDGLPRQTGAPGYTALHPLDFQPVTERERVRRLIPQARARVR